jgi:hypothetical protein
MYMKEYFENLLTAVDQLGNAIAGGNPDVTVSGRVGYQSIVSGSRYWKIMEWIINFTFEPIDGNNHCNKTYMNDNDVDNYNSPVVALVALSFIAGITCIVLIPVIRVMALFY